jgi:hypothetical protein
VIVTGTVCRDPGIFWNPHRVHSRHKALILACSINPIPFLRILEINEHIERKTIETKYKKCILLNSVFPRSGIGFHHFHQESDENNEFQSIQLILSGK